LNSYSENLTLTFKSLLMKYLSSFALKFCMLILTFMTSSYAASFDCAKAGTKVEKLICSTPSLSKLDSDLADIYKDALRKEPATRQEQVSWIKDRNKCADAACLETSYKERMDELTNFIVRSDRNALAVSDINKQATTTEPSNKQALSRPTDPLAYGKCYGGIIGWAKKSSGGLIPNQRAVDFHKTWQPYAAQVAAAATKAGGCVGNFNDSELLQCYKKRLPDDRDATFQWAFNLGIETVMEAPGAAGPMLAQMQCGQLIGYDNKPKASSSSSSSTPSSSQSSSGTVTRIDTSTGNVSITGYARVTVGKSTSVTVNGSRVKNEGDLMVGDRCTVRMESYDLYAQNLVCSR
jgi:uncharacterized protein